MFPIAVTAAIISCHMAIAAVLKHELRVAIKEGKPDCKPKNLKVANDEWQYPLEVTQGDTLQVGGKVTGASFSTAQRGLHDLKLMGMHTCPSA